MQDRPTQVVTSLMASSGMTGAQRFATNGATQDGRADQDKGLHEHAILGHGGRKETLGADSVDLSPLAVA